QGTLVVESALKGGSMTTARVAFSYDREVMAFPGRQNDTYSLGCNQLIKQNIASLVENAEDILKVMNISEDKKISSQIALDFTEENKNSDVFKQEKLNIIKILKERDTSLNELSQKTKISVQSLMIILLKMEIDGIISTIPGGYYRLNSKFITRE
ncbi:MAG: DNA-processing protein DprA, partial [Bacteroides sp.]|nr:DNA-processing protein DprA [Bacteroides sp.]